MGAFIYALSADETILVLVALSVQGRVGTEGKQEVVKIRENRSGEHCSKSRCMAYSFCFLLERGGLPVYCRARAMYGPRSSMDRTGLS